MNWDLTKGPVVKSMLMFAIPMILGDLLQQCYNIADTLIVGQFLGRDALAAVGGTRRKARSPSSLACVWEAARCFPCASGSAMSRLCVRICAHPSSLLRSLRCF